MKYPVHNQISPVIPRTKKVTIQMRKDNQLMLTVRQMRRWDYLTRVLKQLQQTITSSLETNEKIESLSKKKEKRSYKKEPNGNYRTEKHNNK